MTDVHLRQGEPARFGGGDWTADALRARFDEANGTEAIDVAGRRAAGLLDVEGAVDVEGLGVEAPVDSRCV